MNRPLLVLIFGASAGAFLAIGAGCGSSSGAGGSSSSSSGSKSSSSGAGATGTGGHGTPSSSTHASSTATGTGGTGGASGAGGTGGTGGTPPMVDCTTYCDELMTNCTGANAQYPDMTACMNECSYYPVGTNKDKKVNTLGCRVVQGAQAAKSPTAHCSAAGPTGGDEDPSGSKGTCGEPCDAFCAIALVVCANKPNAYASMAACMTECQMFPKDSGPYSATDTTTNDMGCRFTHLSQAAESAGQATLNCAFIHVASFECTM